MVVGYPDGLPTNGSSCWPLVPFSAGRRHLLQLAGDLAERRAQAAAAANGARYVDTFTSSVGHDACKSPGTAWVNGIIPTSAAFPLHPNQAGESQHGQPGLRELCRAMAPDLTDLAVDGIRTLHALRPADPRRAAACWPDSLQGAVKRQDGPDHRRLLGDRRGDRAEGRGGRRRRAARRPHARRSSTRSPSEVAGARWHGRIVHPCDLTDPDDIDRMADEVLRAARARRRPGQQRRQVDPPLGRPLLRPLPRLPADDAAQLLRARSS